MVPPPRSGMQSLRKRFSLLALTVCGGLLLAGGLLPGDGSRSATTIGMPTTPTEEKSVPMVARATLTGHNRQVSAVAFSPDGKIVVTGSDG